MKEVQEDLYQVENLSIIEIEDKNNKWYIKISINDNKSNIINSLKKLQKYDIINYKVEGNDENTFVYLDISR